MYIIDYFSSFTCWIVLRMVIIIWERKTGNVQINNDDFNYRHTTHTSCALLEIRKPCTTVNVIVRWEICGEKPRLWQRCGRFSPPSTNHHHKNTRPQPTSTTIIITATTTTTTTTTTTSTITTTTSSTSSTTYQTHIYAQEHARLHENSVVSMAQCRTLWRKLHLPSVSRETFVYAI